MITRVARTYHRAPTPATMNPMRRWWSATGDAVGGVGEAALGGVGEAALAGVGATTAGSHRAISSPSITTDRATSSLHARATAAATQNHPHRRVAASHQANRRGVMANESGWYAHQVIHWTAGWRR